jgi:hypothetical protein
MGMVLLATFLLYQYALRIAKPIFYENCSKILPTKWAVNPSKKELVIH